MRKINHVVIKMKIDMIIMEFKMHYVEKNQTNMDI